VTSRRSRVWLWLAGFFVVLALLFFGAGGWYFSGQIVADALEVDYPGTVYDLEVTSISADAVTVSDPDGHDKELDKEGLYGLQWKGGYAQIERILEQRPGSATRSFSLLQGAPPSEGTKVDITRYAFPVDAATAFGAAQQDVEFDTPLGAMDAWVVPGARTTWAVLVHGKGATRVETLRALKVFMDAGFPVMSITYRNDRDQPLDPTGHYRYGATEWADLQGAVRYALGNGAEDVVLAGFSTGSAIIASFLDRSSDAGRVRAVVHDSPNLDLEAAVSREALERSLPLVGLPIPRSLLWAAERLTELRTDVDFAELDYVDRAREVDVPQLVLHGTEDARVPIEVSRRLAEDSDTVRLVEFPGADHVEAWNVDRPKFEREMRGFLDQLAA
jgi:alpha-beta hydrolase superfamily lysophospholipase